MARKISGNLIHAFCRYTEETEIPPIYSLWCGISAVSAALGRRCYIDMGHYQIHPNLFVILIAESGRCKKSSAIGVVEKFLPKVKPSIRVFSQKATPEALIGSLSAMTAEGSMVSSSAEGIIIADEIATLINKGSVQSGLVGFLTTLWDAKDCFSYETKSRGKESILNSCVSMLGGSTIDWLRDAITEESIAGGFTARIIFVYCAKPDREILFTQQSEETKKIGEMVVNDLSELSHVRGPFTFDAEAKAFLEAEYVHFMKTSPFHDNKYLFGYANKRTTNLLKLTMIICAGRCNDRLMTLKDATTALKIIKFTEEHLPRVMNAIATSNFGVQNVDLFDLITKNPGLSRRDLITFVHHKMRVEEVDSALSTLEQAGMIKQTASGSNIKIEAVTKKQKEAKSFTDAVLKGEIG